MKLWTPGPTEVRPEILAECARPMIHHRSPDMAALHDRIDPGLRQAFGLGAASRAQVGVHTATATGLMEACLHGAGKRCLCVATGAFGERWLEIARAMGKDAVALPVPWGSTISAEALERALLERGPFDAVTVIANETSTGALAPLALLSEVMKNFPDVLWCVDLVSYLGGGPVEFDRWGVDFAFASVQKALALPPGITVLCASAKYLERARAETRRGFYLDPLRILRGHAERKTPATPCISLYFALARQLEDIASGATLPGAERSLRGEAAWQARFEKHRRMQRRTRGWAEEKGLPLYPAPENASPTVSCIRTGTLDATTWTAGLKKHGFSISSGYGELKPKTIRIGHLGDHTEEGLEELLGAADEVFAELRR